MVYAIVDIIERTGGGGVDGYVLVGMMVMAVMPTTVASNITMVSTERLLATVWTFPFCSMLDAL